MLAVCEAVGRAGRWVQRYVPEPNKRSRLYLEQSNDFWRIGETYVKARVKWMVLYRAGPRVLHLFDSPAGDTRIRTDAIVG